MEDCFLWIYLVIFSIIQFGSPVWGEAQREEVYSRMRHHFNIKQEMKHHLQTSGRWGEVSVLTYVLEAQRETFSPSLWQEAASAYISLEELSCTSYDRKKRYERWGEDNLNYFISIMPWVANTAVSSGTPGGVHEFENGPKRRRGARVGRGQEVQFPWERTRQTAHDEFC